MCAERRPFICFENFHNLETIKVIRVNGLQLYQLGLMVFCFFNYIAIRSYGALHFYLCKTMLQNQNFFTFLLSFYLKISTISHRFSILQKFYSSSNRAIKFFLLYRQAVIGNVYGISTLLSTCE